MLYDVNGFPLFDTAAAEFSENMVLYNEYDAASNANYILLRVFQTKRNGEKQFPFVRAPGRTQATALMEQEDWQLIINGGLGVSEDQPVDGILIENGVVRHDKPCTYHVGSQPLTIDEDGNLGYAPADADAASLVKNGIVSATCGFCPIVEDFRKIEPLADVNINGEGNHFQDNAQRQIIGQFGNGDYAILSCEGRGYDNSDGWTLAEAQDVCIKNGLRFAYNLDGGRSVATIVNKKLITTNLLQYSGEARIVPSFIVFNGSSRFSIPKRTA